MNLPKIKALDLRDTDLVREHNERMVRLATASASMSAVIAEHQARYNRWRERVDDYMLDRLLKGDADGR